MLDLILVIQLVYVSDVGVYSIFFLNWSWLILLYIMVVFTFIVETE